MRFAVPTVDISSYVTPSSPQARLDVTRRVDEACRTVGFVQVVGHGVPDDVVAGLTAAMDAFFALPLAAKKDHVRPRRENRGYTPPKTESLSYSIGVDPVSRMNDFFEAFNVGVTSDDLAQRNLTTDDVDPDDYPDNPWPADLPEFRTAVEAYFTQARRVARTLTRIFADALGVEPAVLERVSDNSLDVLRMNNYALPPGDVELGADLTGMGEHTDFGLVTVLWADRVAGLQVLDQEGSWHDVQPAEGALLVNIGDVMARLTNDQWSSTLHRVKPPVVDGRIERRRSAAFFEDGDPTAVVEPLAAFVPAGTLPLYEPVTLREHVAAKLAGLKSAQRNENAAREAARLGRTAPA